MLRISEIARRIRIGIHDEDMITYEDEQILDAINLGLRFIRRIIMEQEPEILMSERKGILESGANEIVFERAPLQIIEVAVGTELKSQKRWKTNAKIYHNWEKVYGNVTRIYSWQESREYKESPITQTNLHHVRNRYESGRPRYWYRLGENRLRLSPIPEKETGYTVRLIEDLEELGMEDRSPLLTDFDDFLVEYGVIRLPIDNEYDVSQEMQLFSNIASGISEVLYPPPASCRVSGYW